METVENNSASSTHQEKAKKLRKLRRWQVVISLLGIGVMIWGVIQVVCLFLDYKQTETSNDAQIEQYISPVNLRASGYIRKIYFTEHQEVRKGDTLLVLDDREYKIRVMEAEAALKDAQAGATVIGATLQTTQTTASVYDASISEIEIRLAKLEKDRQRYENLVKRNAATPIQLEQIETEYEATHKKLEAVKRQRKAALSGVNEVSHRRESTEAAIQRATAALEMAKLNLSYTVVVATESWDAVPWRKVNSSRQGRPSLTSCPIRRSGLLPIIKKPRLRICILGRRWLSRWMPSATENSQELLRLFRGLRVLNIRWFPPIILPETL